MPAAVEWFGINWNNVQIPGENTHLQYSYKGPSHFRNDAPLYVEINTQPTGEVEITYAILQAYNGCGPKLYFKAAFGDIKVSQSVSVCPAGIHWGDFEHVTLLLNKNLDVVNVKIGYHSWEWDKHPMFIQWENNHPVVYMALGSHALYPTEGEVSYSKLWSDSRKILPRPCGLDNPLEICWVKGESEGGLVDFPPFKLAAHKWKSSNIRVLNINGIENVKNTFEEKKLLRFYGKFGVRIENNGWSAVKEVVLSATLFARTVIKEIDESIRKGLDKANGELQSTASSGLPDKGWWKYKPK